LQNKTFIHLKTLNIMEKVQALAIVTEVMNENFTADQKEAWKRDAQGMPLLVNDTLHCKEITEDNIHVGTIGAGAANAGQKFLQIESVEGTMLGISQIARKGNGLNLEGNTREELVGDFVAKVNTYNEENPDSAGFAIKVKDLKTRPGQNGQMVIPTFTLA
jgi:hypothetical protein